jgi:hypothetical protein
VITPAVIDFSLYFRRSNYQVNYGADFRLVKSLRYNFAIEKVFIKKSFEEEKDFQLLSFMSEFSLHLEISWRVKRSNTGEEKESSFSITKNEPEAG